MQPRRRIPPRNRPPVTRVGAGIAAAAAAVFVLSVERLLFDLPDGVWLVVGVISLVVLVWAATPFVQLLADHLPRVYAPNRWWHFLELLDYEDRVERGIGNYVRTMGVTVSENQVSAADPWLELSPWFINPTPWDLRVVGITGAVTIRSISKQPLTTPALLATDGELTAGSTGSVVIRQPLLPQVAQQVLAKNDANKLAIQLGSIRLDVERVGDGRVFQIPVATSDIKHL